MRLTLILLLLSTFAMAETQLTEIFPTENSPCTGTVELQYSWLSVARFQCLTAGEQNAIVATTRDFLTFSLNSMGKRRLEFCVKRITNIELDAIKNTILSIEPISQQYLHSAVAKISGLAFELCAIPKSSKQQQDRKTA